MARKAYATDRHIKGGTYLSGCGYKGVRRMGSKFGWEYQDGRTCQKKGGYDTAEEAAYQYDEFLIGYVGPDADTNQALGLLKAKDVLQIRDKIHASDKPCNAGRTKHAVGSSGYKGVTAIKPGKSGVVKAWRAQIYLNGRTVTVGQYKDPVEAARMYDAFVLTHVGTDADTNVKLGLLPPLTEPARTVNPPSNPLRLVTAAEVEEDEEEVIPSYQHSSAYCTPEEEREAQRLAALAMADEEEELEEAQAPAAVHAVPLPSTPDPVPESAPVPTEEKRTEVITFSDADKLRARAEEMLRQAAELEAGNLKKQAALQIELLESKLQRLQATMIAMIDHAAEIELELNTLKALFK